MAGFLEMMVGAAAHLGSFSGRIVYEIGSDERLDSAREMVARGARMVLATNIPPVWTDKTAPHVMVLSRDIRGAEQVIGEGTVDFVFGVNILEHINDLPVALASIRRILAKGGYFYLHGHPVWSGPTGHHLLWYDPAETYYFGAENDPLPPWSHLYMSHEEMNAHMEARGVSSGAARGIADAVLLSDGVNRVPFSDMDRTFHESGMQVLDTDVSEEGRPDAETLRRIQGGRWWNPNERYGVRQVRYWGRKVD